MSNTSAYGEQTLVQKKPPTHFFITDSFVEVCVLTENGTYEAKETLYGLTGKKNAFTYNNSFVRDSVEVESGYLSKNKDRQWRMPTLKYLPSFRDRKDVIVLGMCAVSSGYNKDDVLSPIERAIFVSFLIDAHQHRSGVIKQKNKGKYWHAILEYIHRTMRKNCEDINEHSMFSVDCKVCTSTIIETLDSLDMKFGVLSAETVCSCACTCTEKILLITTENRPSLL